MKADFLQNEPENDSKFINQPMQCVLLLVVHENKSKEKACQVIKLLNLPNSNKSSVVVDGGGRTSVGLPLAVTFKVLLFQLDSGALYTLIRMQCTKNRTKSTFFTPPPCQKKQECMSFFQRWKE